MEIRTVKKKVCLITVPSNFLLDERVFPFIGILKVASAYEAQGISVDLLDLCGVENYLDIVKDYFDSKPDVDFVGITSTSPQVPQAFIVAKFIKDNYNQKLVIGGPHATLSHTAYKREQKNKIINGRAKRAVEKLFEVFDIIVAGDGEYSYEDIVSTERGVLDYDDRLSSKFLTNQQLTELPMPARHLIDLDSYNYTIEGVRAVHLLLQYGCPYSCNFCSGRNSPSLRFIRTRTTESALAEIEYLHKELGFSGFNFFDDELNVNKQMIPLMYGIADLQNKYGVDFKLRGFTKSEIFTEEQAKAMKTAGFKWMLTGFESGSPEILKNINKKATLEDNTRCVEIAKKYDLKVKALCSIGHSSESAKTVAETKDWLIKMDVEEMDATVISCYPGAPYYDDARLDESTGNYIYTGKYGDKLYQKEVDFTKESNSYKGIPGQYVSYVWTDHLTAEQLVEERNKLEDEVRSKLNIPYNPSNPSRKYEMSYGSSRNMPDWILRSTATHPAPAIKDIEASTLVDLSDADPALPPSKKSLKVIS
jgi:radical SAM superfamily enzyme YgiQ (UPF0313 family)